MKKYFELFMPVILSAFVLTGCGSDQNTEAITELQATIDDLQSQVEEYSALKAELDSANDTIAELQSEIDALKAEKDEMSSKLEALYKIEPLDETMFTISDADIYDDLYAEALGEEPTGTISEGQEVKVVGKSAVIDWYVIKTSDGTTQMVSASLVSQTKPSTNTGSSGTGSTGQTGNTGNTGNTQQPFGTGQPSGGGQQPPADDGFDADSWGLPEWGQDGVNGRFENFEIE